ncbi:tRNA (pseudouridine(54)-N(1))-methyltransferase TrmY [soil metagenome]
MRTFVIVGQTALASGAFGFDDFPGTSGRMDVLARAVRATLLVSHGVRHDTRLYLVMLGGDRAPRTVRFEGATVRFLRPDERSNGLNLKKILERGQDTGPEFAPVRDGIAIAKGGIETVLPDLGRATRYVLDENAPDVRAFVPVWDEDLAFLLGDHRGLDEASRVAFAASASLSVGPMSLHTEDAVVLLQNTLDRAAAPR